MNQKRLDGLTARAREMLALVEEQRSSGLTLAAFAEQRGVKKGTLSWWTWRLRQLEEGSPMSAPTLIPVRVVADAPRRVADQQDSSLSSFVLAFGDGRRLDIPAGFAAEDLKRILDVVSSC